MSNQPVQPNGGEAVNQQGAAPPQQPQPAQPVQPAQPAISQAAADAALLQQNGALQQQNVLLQAQLQQYQAQAAHPIRMKELKLPEPKIYQGSKDKTPIRMWLKDVEEIFIIGGIPPDHRTTITYAAHYLATEPKTWYKMHENVITTWQQFKDIMVQRYKDPREVDKLRQKLASIRQLTSVDSYTVAFDKTTLELTEAAGYVPREEELIFLYREGLKTQIKTLVVARGTITSLKQLQETALEIDAALYAARTPLKPDLSPHRSHYQEFNGHNERPSNDYGNKLPNRQHTSRYINYPNNSYRPLHYSDHYGQPSDDKGYAPMDTSNAIPQRTRPRLSDNKYDKPKGNCFNCGIQGHYAKDCKKQPKQQQRTNIIMQENNSIEQDSVLIINEPTPSDKLMTFNGLIDLYSARILIDCGATTNYISDSFAKQHGIYIEKSISASNTKLADGTSLNVKHIAPDLQVHIQNYIDDINADVIPLVHYDMVLGMTWLEKHGATVDHTSRVITFNFEGDIIRLQPDTKSNTSTVLDNQTQLIKDDQHLKAEEGTVGARDISHDSYEIIPTLPTTSETSAHTQLSNVITTLLFILLVIILSTAYAWYSTADHMVEVTTEYSPLLVSPLAEYQPKFNVLSFLFHSTLGFKNVVGLIYILLCMYSYNYKQRFKPVYSPTIEKALEHYGIALSQDSILEYTHPKSKKGYPR